MGFVPFLKQNNGPALILKDNDGVWWAFGCNRNMEPSVFSFFKVALLFDYVLFMKRKKGNGK